jgi:hypothetical protein
MIIKNKRLGFRLLSVPNYACSLENLSDGIVYYLLLKTVKTKRLRFEFIR